MAWVLRGPKSYAWGETRMPAESLHHPETPHQSLAQNMNLIFGANPGLGPLPVCAVLHALQRICDWTGLTQV